MLAFVVQTKHLILLNVETPQLPLKSKGADVTVHLAEDTKLLTGQGPIDFGPDSSPYYISFTPM